jgi:hypothetical protein
MAIDLYEAIQEHFLFVAFLQKQMAEHNVNFMIPFDTELKRLLQSIDWASTPLGPVSQWPQSFRTMISICLNNKFPSNLLWGPNFVQIYNESYTAVLGNRHPAAMGQPISGKNYI